MTTIDIVRTDDAIELTASDHAGNKVMCAVCSANVCNLINICEKELNEHRLDYLRWDVSSGFSRVEAKCFPEFKERFNAICDMVIVAFDSLAEKYSDNFRITIR